MRLLASLALLGCASTTALAQSPQLVLDITPGAAGSTISDAVDVAGTLYFMVRAPSGDTLWRSDGTGAGTVPVHAFPAPSISARELTAFGDRLLLLGNDATHGVEPWISDGTPGGTQLLLDVNPGTSTSNTGYFAAMSGVAIFAAYEPVHGMTIWRTDGTPAGTAVVDPIDPQLQNCNPAELHSLGDEVVFFRNWYSIGQTEIWRTDGTPQGTYLISFTGTLGEVAQPNFETCVSNGRLYFARYGSLGKELWVTDGSAFGTFQYDVNPGGVSSNPGQFVATDTGILFSARVDNVLGLYHVSPVTGVVLVNDPSTTGGVVTSDGQLVVWRDASAGVALWSSDGTPGGTAQVADLYLGGTGNGPSKLTAVGDRRTYFFAWSGSSAVKQSELWLSDGTTAGTVMFDVNPGAGASSGGAGSAIVESGAALFVVLDDGVHGAELHAVRPTGVVSKIGGDCGPGVGHQVLDSDDPVLGTSVEVRGLGVGYEGMAFLFAGVQSPALPIAPGCASHLDLGSIQLVATAFSPFGGPWTANVNLPANPALDGVKLALQAAHVTGLGPPTVSVTNALIWVLGN